MNAKRLIVLNIIKTKQLISQLTLSAPIRHLKYGLTGKKLSGFSQVKRTLSVRIIYAKHPMLGNRNISEYFLFLSQFYKVSDYKLRVRTFVYSMFNVIPFLVCPKSAYWVKIFNHGFSYVLLFNWMSVRKSIHTMTTLAWNIHWVFSNHAYTSIIFSALAFCNGIEARFKFILYTQHLYELNNLISLAAI